MKAKNLNNASKKTQKIIKRVFAEMLSEKQSLSKISVSELCERAEISRGAFYSHYDDIYSVVEDYENELIDNFFDNAKLIGPKTFEQFIDVFFDYIKKNNDNYKLLCKSNDVLYSSRKLSLIATNKILELCNKNPNIKNKTYLELDIKIFVNGLLIEYVKYCRGLSQISLDDLYSYTKSWANDFSIKRFSNN